MMILNEWVFYFEFNTHVRFVYLFFHACTLSVPIFFIFLAVPKANSVFTVDIHGYLCTLYGNQLRVRSAERVSKKFKTKRTTDL